MPQFKLESYPIVESPVERLPSELLHKILISVSSPSKRGSISLKLPGTSSLIVDPNARINPRPCLLPCLLTSRTFFIVAIPIMYRNIEISRASTLERAVAQITKQPILGTFVRILDLSNLCCPDNESPLGNLLLDVLSAMPLIREFRINSSMEDHLNHDVLQKLFCELPFMETLELSGSNSATFVHACSLVVKAGREVTKSIRSLSLAGCRNLPPQVFDLLLPRLPSLQHLDISNTQITTLALCSIPRSAKLTYLNISHCHVQDVQNFVDFLFNHPSTKELVNLNMETDEGLEHHILSKEDISQLLPRLPPTLKVLNLKNSAMTCAHAKLLSTLSVHVEQLSVGTQLRFRDIEELLLGVDNADEEGQERPALEEEEELGIISKYQAILSPIEDAIASCKLRQRINSYPEVMKATSVRYLDISSLPLIEQGKINTSVLLGPQSMPLQMIEISEKVVGRYEVLPKLCAAVGWDFKSVGRRCWLRRRSFSSRRERL